MKKRYTALLTALGSAVAVVLVPGLGGSAEASDGTYEQFIVTFDGSAVGRQVSSKAVNALRELPPAVSWSNPRSGSTGREHSG